MSCNFCRTTNVNPCPVCTVAPSTGVLRKTPRKAPSKVATARAPAFVIKASPPVALASMMPARRVVAGADECAQAWGAKQYTLATGYLVKLANPEHCDTRTAILELIDLNSAKRGYLSEQDKTTLGAIGRAAVVECLARIGFDPRYPQPAAVVHAQSPTAYAPGYTPEAAAYEESTKPLNTSAPLYAFPQWTKTPTKA